jgi:type IV pilus assembly protein PilB
MIHDPATRAEGVRQVYTDLNRKFEEEETQRKAKISKIPYINLYGFAVDTEALAMLSKSDAKSYEAVVFFHEGKKIKLGLTDSANIEAVVKLLKDQEFEIQVFLISKSSFQHFLTNYDKIKESSHTSDAVVIDSKDRRFATNLKAFSATLEQLTASEAIGYILGTALSMNVSDVHIEPEKENLKIRFRIDGVLQDIAKAGIHMHQLLISRIKILSKLKLNVTASPQDGSFSLTFDKSLMDVRVSVLPSAFGESVTLRLLRQDQGLLELMDLGIRGVALERIQQKMQKPNGMILSTGPTGSGKTSTLYAIVNKLNEPGVKIITLEDPVEYKLEGITQTPIDTRNGMTFASGLKAILRQDPDIVMIGEMRDLETAETGCQAALTGHVVLSTLHTNDAAAAIPRLLDLGVKPFVLAPAINAIIGQRLVRKLCESCKQPYMLTANLLSRVEMILKEIPKAAKVVIPKKLVFYHSLGCDQCQGLGYKGRMGVYEVFTISEEIEKLITKGATTSEIKKQAVTEGMLTMAQDGILKALDGITDVEEVFRVTEE